MPDSPVVVPTAVQAPGAGQLGLHGAGQGRDRLQPPAGTVPPSVAAHATAATNVPARHRMAAPHLPAPPERIRPVPERYHGVTWESGQKPRPHGR
jgi:hypothetical protein